MTTRWILAFLVVLVLSPGVASFQSHVRRRTWTVTTTTTTAFARRERQREPRPPPSSTTRRERRPTVIQRAPHQYDHTQEEARPFVKDPLEAVKTQDPNEDATPYDLKAVASDDSAADEEKRQLITHPHVTTYSLDDLFPGLGFSERFNANEDFRNELRDAMREDIFDTTPAYHGMSEKARTFLLLPDSSLQGSWKCQNGGWSRPSEDDGTTRGDGPRMRRLTRVLRSHLGDDADAPTGDAFMDTIGALCGGENPSTHWMDIVGVLNRRIPHSWHQDTGDSARNKKTVLLGFPPSDHYHGVGVFSHLVKLKYEEWAPVAHAINEPVLFELPDMPEECIVRPVYGTGREIIVYRDVDVLHSSPDIAHRMSVMRFM